METIENIMATPAYYDNSELAPEQPKTEEVKETSEVLEVGDHRVKEDTINPIKKDAQDEKKQELKIEDNVNLTEIISKVNEFVDSVSTRISFKYDNETDQSIINVIDRDTDEIIRQIPPKDMVELSKRMDELTGIIYKGTA